MPPLPLMLGEDQTPGDLERFPQWPRARVVGGYPASLPNRLKRYPAYAVKVRVRREHNPVDMAASHFNHQSLFSGMHGA